MWVMSRGCRGKGRAGVGVEREQEWSAGDRSGVGWGRQESHPWMMRQPGAPLV